MRRLAASRSPAGSRGASRIAQRTRRSCGRSPAACSAATWRSKPASCAALPSPPGNAPHRPRDLRVRIAGLPAQPPGERVQLAARGRAGGADPPAGDGDDAGERDLRGLVVRGTARLRLAPARAERAASKRARGTCCPSQASRSAPRASRKRSSLTPAAGGRRAPHLGRGAGGGDRGRGRPLELAPVEGEHRLAEHLVPVDDDPRAVDADDPGAAQRLESRLDLDGRLEHRGGEARRLRGVVTGAEAVGEDLEPGRANAALGQVRLEPIEPVPRQLAVAGGGGRGPARHPPARRRRAPRGRGRPPRGRRETPPASSASAATAASSSARPATRARWRASCRRASSAERSEAVQRCNRGAPRAEQPRQLGTRRRAPAAAAPSARPRRAPGAAAPRQRGAQVRGIVEHDGDAARRRRARSGAGAAVPRRAARPRADRRRPAREPPPAARRRRRTRDAGPRRRTRARALAGAATGRAARRRAPAGPPAPRTRRQAARRPPTRAPRRRAAAPPLRERACRATGGAVRSCRRRGGRRERGCVPAHAGARARRVAAAAVRRPCRRTPPGRARRAAPPPPQTCAAPPATEASAAASAS